MLEKFIIHQKNTIFFKLVIYFLFISILLAIAQDLKKNYEESASANQNAQITLTEETLKLASIINSKAKILETCKKYTELLAISNNQRCFEKINIIKKLKNLSTEYHLQEAITTVMTQVFHHNAHPIKLYHEDDIKIENYDVMLKFASPDFLTNLAIIKAAYNHMPDKTITVSAKIKKQRVLESKFIYKLSEKKFPELIFTKLIMRTRELVVKK